MANVRILIAVDQAAAADRKLGDGAEQQNVSGVQGGRRKTVCAPKSPRNSLPIFRAFFPFRTSTDLKKCHSIPFRHVCSEYIWTETKSLKISAGLHISGPSRRRGSWSTGERSRCC